MIPVFILAIDDPECQSRYAQAYIRYSKQLIALASLALYGKTSADNNEQTQAEDIVQEAFRYVLEKESLPKDPDHAKALLITVTKHIATDVLRKNRRIADEEPTELQLGYTIPEHSSTLSLIVDALPDIYREVIILYYEYGYKATELADMLGLSYSTILKRLERARNMIKEQYLNDK